MTTWRPCSRPARRCNAARLRPVARSIAWLRRHQALVLVLTIAGIVTSFFLDLAIPGYAIAGFYLIPLMLVAFALRARVVAVVVGLGCAVLTVTVMVLQGRAKRTERAARLVRGTRRRGIDRPRLPLQPLRPALRGGALQHEQAAAPDRAAQGLQELSALSAERPLADLLRDIVVQACQLLESDGGALFRHDALADLLRLEAAVGPPFEGAAQNGQFVGNDPPGRAVRERRVVMVPNVAAIEAGLVSGDGADRRTGGHRWPGSRRHRRPLGRGASGLASLHRRPARGRRGPLRRLALYFRVRRRSPSRTSVSLSRSATRLPSPSENTRLRERLEQSAVAAERSRLARDLHDSVTQSLFAARLKAESLLQRSAPESPEAGGVSRTSTG